jgi:lipopolysaccharide/colanic/teichoic acid biosynthesis glycosyltransferase
MLVTALLIKLESRGPGAVPQERVGQNSKTFMVTKFRSMRTDAEKDGKPVWASRQRQPRDPRGASSAACASTNCRSCSTCSRAR